MLKIRWILEAVGAGFGRVLGSVLGGPRVPRGDDEGLKRVLKARLKKDGFGRRFWRRLGAVLGPKLAPCWGHVGSKNGA